MQRLSGKSMVGLCKSCRIFHIEPKNFSLHFYDFSLIVYGFSKFQQKPFTIGD
jgi:hypothetical protein